MKRDFLKNLKLSDEQIDAIMAENGRDVEATNAKLKELTTENGGLKDQLSDRDKDIKTLKSQAKGSDKLQQSLSDLEKKYKEDTESLTSQLNQTKLDTAVDNALNAANARSTKAVRGLLDMDSVSLNDKGEVIGLAEQVATLKEKEAYLFDEGSRTPYKPHGGNAGGNAGGGDEEESLAKMAQEARLI